MCEPIVSNGCISCCSHCGGGSAKTGGAFINPSAERGLNASAPLPWREPSRCCCRRDHCRCCNVTHTSHWFGWLLVHDQGRRQKYGRDDWEQQQCGGHGEQSCWLLQGRCHHFHCRQQKHWLKRFLLCIFVVTTGMTTSSGYRRRSCGCGRERRFIKEGCEGLAECEAPYSPQGRRAMWRHIHSTGKGVCSVYDTETAYTGTSIQEKAKAGNTFCFTLSRGRRKKNGGEDQRQQYS